MIQMKALVGFSDRALATHMNPTGAYGASAPITAPNVDEAKRLEEAGLAERVKQPATPATKA